MATDYNALFANPWLQMGLGILSANKPGAGTGPAIGQGMLGGMANYQAMQDRQRKLEELQRVQAAQAQVAQQYPQLAPMLQAYPQAGGQILAAMMQPQKPEELVQAMVDGRAQWVPRSQAAGLPTVPKAPLVTVGSQFRALPDEMELAIQKDTMDYLRDQAGGAQEKIEQARRGLNLLKQGETGRWEPLVGSAAAWAGISPETAARYDIWRDFATEQALQNLQAFKGPTTDFEFRIAQSLAAQQGKTPLANFVALKAMERGALRARERRNMYSTWFRQHRQQNPNFDEWHDANTKYPQWGLEDFTSEFSKFRGKRGARTDDEGLREQGYLR